MNAENNEADLLLASASLAKSRIAAWNRKHKTMYDSRAFASRSEQFAQDYIKRGPASFLGPEPETETERLLREANERVEAHREKRRSEALFAHLDRLRHGNIRAAIFAGQPLARHTILELENGQALIDSGSAIVAEDGSPEAKADIGTPPLAGGITLSQGLA